MLRHRIFCPNRIIPKWVEFHCTSTNSLKVDKIKINLEYSFDHENWSAVTTSLRQINFGVSGDVETVLYLRGDNPTGLNSTKLEFNHKNNLVDVRGNAMYLLNSTEELTVVPSNAFASLFNGCSTLNSISKGFLPATELGTGCYSQMFSGCQNLLSAPDLPATILAQGCYKQMFGNCSKLVTAPDLLAETTVQECYSGMFNNCKTLGYIKCMVKTFSSNNDTKDWMKGVSNSGTFVKSYETTWQTGSNGIPNGWTVIDE